jgi:pantothenate kinase-related protein Tda10
MATTYADFVDTYLTIPAAAEALAELGLECTARQMRRWADDRKLPFFQDLSGKRVIGKTVLFAHFFQLQCDAQKRMAA